MTPGSPAATYSEVGLRNWAAWWSAALVKATFLVGIAELLSYGVANTFIRYVQTYIPYV
jgi:hypothetical protein